jgi:signal transduction histidine kinase
MEEAITRGRPPAGPVFSRGQAAVVWSVVAVLFIAQGIASAVTQGRPISWQWDVVHELIYWSLWAAASPLIGSLARRFWVEPGGGAGPWVALAGAGLLVAPIQVSVTYLVHGVGLVVFGLLATADLPGWLGGRQRSVLILSFTGFLYYWVILGAYYALAYRRLYLIQRAEAAEASLAALRTQLQPHFLFNTLNSVAVLAEESPPTAALVLTRLSELLRRVLRQDPRHEIPLAEELAILEGYLEIQRVRFEERLRVMWSIDPTVRQARVPELILQPLVENAVRYAVEPRVEGGAIEIRAERAGDRLVLEVVDDGPGLSGAARSPDGGRLGIAVTRARLDRLYGPDHEFRLEPGDRGGLRARLALPFRNSGTPAR